MLVWLARAGWLCMVIPVSDIQELTRRWSGYVCPDCRYVFRVPRDHDGRGVVCPNCRRMMKLPVEGVEVPPLVVPMEQKPAPTADHDEPMAALTAHDGEAEAHPPVSREPSRTRERGRSRKSWPMPAKVAIGAAACAVLLLAGWNFVRQPSSPQPAEGTAMHVPATVPDVPEADLDPEQGAPKVMDPSRFESEAEPIARKFLNAESVDQLLEVVYQPKECEAKIRAYYPAGKVKPPGIAKYNIEGMIRNENGCHVVTVQTRNFDKRELVFVRTAQGLKIDWESWVAWSEMSWPDMLAKHPEMGVEMRVVLSDMDYYNYLFRDDTKWKSYRVESGDGEHVLYAYVPRNSELQESFDRLLRTGGSKCIVKLHFISGSENTQQVIADQLLWPSWTKLEENTGTESR